MLAGRVSSIGGACLALILSVMPSIVSTARGPPECSQAESVLLEGCVWR